MYYMPAAAKASKPVTELCLLHSALTTNSFMLEVSWGCSQRDTKGGIADCVLRYWPRGSPMSTELLKLPAFCVHNTQTFIARLILHCMLASALQYPAAEAVYTVDAVQPYAAGVFISKPRNMARTVSYAAPEMTKGYCGEFLGQLCAMGCDVWAVGCVALLLYTGNNSFAVKDDDDDKDRSSLALHNKWVIPSGRFMQIFCKCKTAEDCCSVIYVVMYMSAPLRSSM